MALDPALAERYGTLFATYGAGAADLLVRTKGMIAERQNVLREDAMYFLLVNMDHMVIRSLFGYIPQPGSVLGRPMNQFSGPDDVERMVRDTLDIIMGELQGREAQLKYSANAVIRAISARSQDIADRIAWWKED